MPNLRPGQYKRLGRIAENNPERAERVADRMEKRASRTDRGKEIAGNAEERRTGGRNIERDIQRGVAKMYEGIVSEKNYAKNRLSQGAEQYKTNPAHEQARKRDTPLSTTPEPISVMTGKINK